MERKLVVFLACVPRSCVACCFFFSLFFSVSSGTEPGMVRMVATVTTLSKRTTASNRTSYCGSRARVCVCVCVRVGVCARVCCRLISHRSVVFSCACVLLCVIFLLCFVLSCVWLMLSRYGYPAQQPYGQPQAAYGQQPYGYHHGYAQQQAPQQPPPPGAPAAPGAPPVPGTAATATGSAPGAPGAATSASAAPAPSSDGGGGGGGAAAAAAAASTAHTASASTPSSTAAAPAAAAAGGSGDAAAGGVSEAERIEAWRRYYAAQGYTMPAQQ